MAANQLYQYSVMAALMDGVAEKGLPVDQLLTHGDFGLGTFRHMEGEMAIHEGRIWQMTSNGGIRQIDPSTGASCPFAMLTRFQPTIQDTLASSQMAIHKKDDLATWLRRRLPDAKNLFVALRLRGLFASVTIRIIPKQAFRGQKLAELSAEQVEHTATNLRGTVIGFRSPAFAAGFGVPGLHLHFLSDDGNYGGHILDLVVGEGENIEFEAAQMSHFQLELPTDDPDYNAAPLKPDLAAIEKAEK